MNAYAPKRHERGQWIVGVIGPWSEWKRTICRDYYAARFWLRRNWSVIAAVLIFAIGTATLIRTVAIYAPNPHVPFLPAISAVRG